MAPVPTPVRSDTSNGDGHVGSKQQVLQAAMYAEPEFDATVEEANSSVPQYAHNTGLVDFSKLDFSSMSPQEIEQMYIASISQANQVQSMPATADKHRSATMFNPTTLPTSTNGLSWDNHPSTMMVHLEDIVLRRPVNNIQVRFSFRHKRVKVDSAPYPHGHREQKQKFECNYHSLLFDHLKVDIYEGGFFGSHIGRVHIRLSRLPQLLGDLEHTYTLNHRKAHRSSKLASKDIGEITIGFSFIGARRGGTLTRSQSASSRHGPSDESMLLDKMIGSSEEEMQTSEYMDYYQQMQAQDADMYGDMASETRSMISMRSTASSATTATSKRRRKRIIAENTMLGIKEVAQLASAFFGSGWKLNKMEIARSMLFVQKYYQKFHPNAMTNDVVTDGRQIRVACYFLNYAMCAYGSLLMNFFGYGKGYLRDAARPKMDSATAREHLGLGKNDMLAWDFQLELFKPQVFICRDPKLNAIVIAIRGTFNLHEMIVDITAEYTPFSHGYAHKGMLRCAEYLELHYLDRIKAWVSQYKCSAIYVTGHSLGGGVASLLTMILTSHIPELRQLSDNRKFKLKCYNYGSPPSVNAELCEEFEPYIETYINENDLVARSSWGAVCDFRDLILKGHDLLNEKKLSTQDRMERLAEHHTHLKESNEHPKVFIPGKIFYVYKSTRVFSSTSRPRKDGQAQREITGNPLIDDPTPHYLLERSTKELFCNIQFKTNFLIHHIPNKYNHSLRMAHNYLEENEDLHEGDL
ncbi:uncharacterized protein EV422DRAFT_318078 [Fimicolochytrium jonesii]|uniref:uncharacterized protein n=1 Tax=Fimicolochytrium jonesii TaxID=1396493 RepID=UPI0022FE4F7C|nr:uncharacterized protein EV422DRAFT_318078 [Fimicolochytrium jonesii]KAI8824365.1 hypothetical protein EV422DRAFT_318078 [Fimicolochytrium jonesii]